MGDDFETFSCSRMARSDALPHLPGEAKRAATPLKTGIVPPELSTRDPCSRSFAEQWSPASTVRSTPPFDSQQSSPAAARPPSFRRLVEIDSGVDAKSVPLCGARRRYSQKPSPILEGFCFPPRRAGGAMVSNRRGLGSDVSGWLPPAVIQRREIPPPPAFAFVLPNVLDLRSVAATGPVPSVSYTHLTLPTICSV